MGRLGSGSENKGNVVEAGARGRPSGQYTGTKRPAAGQEVMISQEG